MNYLSVEKISKSYGERVLFEDVSFGIDKGQKVALVAKNGSGKTSLLNILVGKDVPNSGNIVWRNGINVGFLNSIKLHNFFNLVAVRGLEDIINKVVPNYQNIVENSFYILSLCKKDNYK